MSGERKTTNERLEELQTADSYDSISVTGQSADWVFYNQSGGSYVIGHGGGATMQHSYCTDISWQTHSPVTWCSTRIIPMWASLAAGTQTENC